MPPMNHLLRIGYLGPSATFSHEAARKKFGTTAEYVPSRSIPDVFYATARGEVDLGVVPVENAIEGAVTYTLDTFARPDPELTDLTIQAEFFLPIVQNLLVAPNGPQNLGEVELVYTMPQPLGQCRIWLHDNLPHAELQEVSSTAMAAELALSNPHAAGIANLLAAEKYGLTVLAPEIQDADFNQTRFLVIGLPTVQGVITHTEDYTTAIMISIKDRVGALHAVTSLFEKYNLNMNRIESRPSKQKAWDYLFFIDFIGHPQQPHVAALLHDLNNETDSVKLLGSWPREVE